MISTKLDNSTNIIEIKCYESPNASDLIIIKVMSPVVESTKD